jgi:tetratricopeptide (TPR) repeat protein
MGRFEESLAESQRALALDPLDVAMNFHLGFHYIFARQYDQAIAQLQKTLEMSRNSEGAHGILGLAYEQKGLYNEAIAEYQKSMELGDIESQRRNLGHVYAISGMRGEAQKVLDQLLEESKHKYVSPYSIAIIYEGLGEKDRAFAWLEKAYAERDSNITNLKVDPWFDSLHSDPRFADLLSRVGLPQ